jgi:hypothetical protein
MAESKFLHGEDNDKEFSNVIRGMIVHEDDLTNQRLTWMATLNGLMLAALGVMLGVIWQKEPVVVGWQHYLIIWAFCLFGIVICISSWLTLMASHLARERLQALWDRRFQLQKWVSKSKLEKCDTDKIEDGTPPRMEAIPPLKGWFEREEEGWTEAQKAQAKAKDVPPWTKPLKGIWKRPWVMYLLPWTILPLGLGGLWLFLLILTVIDCLRRPGF